MFDEKKIQEIDSLNMFDILKNFPAQVKDAISIGMQAPLFPGLNISSLKNDNIDVLVLGMGGSAIGGDILKSYCQGTPGAEHINISVNRNYNVGGSVHSGTNVIASSYSGETEETISALRQVLGITKNVICITTGGQLEKIAIENNLPVIKIPPGMQPRCALGYSFFTMLYLLITNNFFEDDAEETTENAIEELLSNLDQKALTYSDFKNEDNLALNTASKLHGTIPVIYSSVDRLDAINCRWRGQIQENAKNLAFGNTLPEMNHNEINGWNFPDNMTKNFSVIFLKDKEDNPRTQIRFQALSSIIEEKVGQILSFEGEGDNLLTRMFDLIYLADWLSYYLAIYNQIDPTPIPYISKLKNFLASKK